MWKLVAASLLAFVLSSTAWAQGAGSAPRGALGRKGSMTLEAERLFGLSYASSGGASVTTFSLLGSSGMELGAAPHAVPRLAFDYFLADGLSLGLGAELAFISPNVGSITVFGVNPRVGYLARVTDLVGFWGRGGFDYVTLSASSGPGSPRQSAYYLAMALEIQVVITPVPHFGFLVGPAFDVGLAATDRRLTQVGLQAGLFGWL